jgi:hypothetical protein
MMLTKPVSPLASAGNVQLFHCIMTKVGEQIFLRPQKSKISANGVRQPQRLLI